MKQLIGLTMLLGSSTLQAQSFDAALRQKMEYHLRQASEKYDIPNVEVLIIKDDTVFYHQSIGEHVSAHTPYYLGSVSKSLTALGLLKLIDLGKASLDDKLTDILPEIKLTQYAEEVTLRTLLNHTSGIAKRDGFQPVPKLNELAGWTVAINERPGLKHEYSNLNYVLIGWVLEQIAGQSLDNYMRMHVFEPLKMQHTYACKKEIASQKVITQYQYFYGIVKPGRLC